MILKGKAKKKEKYITILSQSQKEILKGRKKWISI